MATTAVKLADIRDYLEGSLELTSLCTEALRELATAKHAPSIRREAAEELARRSFDGAFGKEG